MPLQERARWGRILEALRLVPRQEEALLALRKQHLSKLKQIYHQRQSLNMQVCPFVLSVGWRFLHKWLHLCCIEKHPGGAVAPHQTASSTSLLHCQQLSPDYHAGSATCCHCGHYIP